MLWTYTMKQVDMSHTWAGLWWLMWCITQISPSGMGRSRSGGVGLPMTHSWDTYRDLQLAEGSYFTLGFTPSRGKPHPKLGQCGEIKTCPPCLNLGQILRAVPTLELLIKLIVTSLPNALEFNFLHPSLLLLLPCRRFPQQHSPINSLHRVSSPSLFHGKPNLR